MLIVHEMLNVIKYFLYIFNKKLDIRCTENKNINLLFCFITMTITDIESHNCTHSIVRKY